MRQGILKIFKNQIEFTVGSSFFQFYTTKNFEKFQYTDRYKKRPNITVRFLQNYICNQVLMQTNSLLERNNKDFCRWVNSYGIVARKLLDLIAKPMREMQMTFEEHCLVKAISLFQKG